MTLWSLTWPLILIVGVPLGIGMLVVSAGTGLRTEEKSEDPTH